MSHADDFALAQEQSRFDCRQIESKFTQCAGQFPGIFKGQFNEYVEIAYTVGAKPRQILTDVLFRSMLPSLFDSLRITLGWCWTYLIVAEIVAADSGLGFVIWTARRYMQTTDVMAGVVAIGLIGLVTDQILRRLHTRLFRYL